MVRLKWTGIGGPTGISGQAYGDRHMWADIASDGMYRSEMDRFEMCS